MEGNRIKLYGFAIIGGRINCVEGLHIGSSNETIEIGGIDSLVIKNPVTNQPFIPGSSLKGKLRSTLEKLYGLPLDKLVKDIFIHLYVDSADPHSKSIIRTFGGFSTIMQGDERKKGDKNWPSRLNVRDSLYSENTVKKYMDHNRPITEAKAETAIDRITSAAHPRTIERVPAGAEFEFELVYKIESTNMDSENINNETLADLKNIITSLEIIDKYSGLGGYNSRGSGKVKFYIDTFEFKMITGESAERYRTIDLYKNWSDEGVADYNYFINELETNCNCMKV